MHERIECLVANQLVDRGAILNINDAAFLTNRRLACGSIQPNGASECDTRRCMPRLQSRRNLQCGFTRRADLEARSARQE